jgi:choline dehydrogenase
MSSGLPGAEPDDILYVAMNHGGIGVESDSAQFGEAMINLILMEAKSRGTVELTSANPFDQPVVEENMLDHPLDIARMRKAYRHLGKIAAGDAIQAITEKALLGDSDLPLTWLDTASDDELDDFLLKQSSDAQHGIGGCCMGPEGHAVVDPDCRVYGFEGLRVIDASIMPLDCQANTNLTAIMIGEKMADSLVKSGI